MKKSLGVPCQLSLGNLLGQWKDENSGEKCRSFITLGAKTYAMTMLSGKSIVKAKGISAAARHLSFDSFRLLLQNALRNVESEGSEDASIFLQTCPAKIEVEQEQWRRIMVPAAGIRIVAIKLVNAYFFLGICNPTQFLQLYRKHLRPTLTKRILWDRETMDTKPIGFHC